MKNEAATILNVRVAGSTFRAAILRATILSDLAASFVTALHLPAHNVANRQPIVDPWKQRSYADFVQAARVSGDTRCGTGDTLRHSALNCPGLNYWHNRILNCYEN